MCFKASTEVCNFVFLHRVVFLSSCGDLPTLLCLFAKASMKPAIHVEKLKQILYVGGYGNGDFGGCLENLEAVKSI